MLLLWDKCAKARAYIATVQEKAAENSEGVDVDSWVEWANQQVDEVESTLLHPQT